MRDIKEEVQLTFFKLHCVSFSFLFFLIFQLKIVLLLNISRFLDKSEMVLQSVELETKIMKIIDRKYRAFKKFRERNILTK